MYSRIDSSSTTAAPGAAPVARALESTRLFVKRNVTANPKLKRCSITPATDLARCAIDRSLGPYRASGRTGPVARSGSHGWTLRPCRPVRCRRHVGVMRVVPVQPPDARGVRHLHARLLARERRAARAVARRGRRVVAGGRVHVGGGAELAAAVLDQQRSEHAPPRRCTSAINGSRFGSEMPNRGLGAAFYLS
jgi:hypothetical protein